ncbi:hypothetical protein RLOC_00005309 [Lonchura striata]|uniref:Uncharacterized protein n=1 Tax=Lonchura striata TaxID=40157 RepID=A0A218VDZ2_9PASE|nr:hypothetical protein RLOC_00005309 [Lonchura striata domestica]
MKKLATREKSPGRQKYIDIMTLPSPDKHGCGLPGPETPF